MFSMAVQNFFESSLTTLLLVPTESCCLLHIQKILGSNHSPEISYPDLGFLWVSSVPSGKCWDLKLGHDIFLPHPFNFIIH
jgi:hypothetical protein